MTILWYYSNTRYFDNSADQITYRFFSICIEKCKILFILYMTLPPAIHFTRSFQIVCNIVIKNQTNLKLGILKYTHSLIVQLVL